MSPPNLPTAEFFVPLGALLEYVRAGNKFEPVRVDDVRSGEGWAREGGRGGRGDRRAGREGEGVGDEWCRCCQ